MKNIDYRHNMPLSIKAKLIQSTMDLMGLKKKIEKKMISNDFEKDPTEPSKALVNNFDIKLMQQKNRKIWIVSPKVSKTDVVILYLHGGGYMANITKEHWRLIEALINITNATIVVPDYPLVPESSCKEIYDFTESLYERLIIDYPKRRIIFIGDSAGGGLAFGFVQHLRNEQKKQPEQIILLSPWLDVSMNNPKIKLIDESDKMLSIKGLRNAGKKYAGNLDLKDYRVSPIYGDLTELCQLSIFTGTNDLLDADAQKCKKLMKDQQINFNYFEYPQMFHDWVIISSLKETSDVITKVKGLIDNDARLINVEL